MSFQIEKTCQKATQNAKNLSSEPTVGPKSGPMLLEIKFYMVQAILPLSAHQPSQPRSASPSLYLRHLASNKNETILLPLFVN